MEEEAVATASWRVASLLRYKEDEELLPDHGDKGMFDVQAAMEKQLMLACRKIRHGERETISRGRLRRKAVSTARRSGGNTS